MTRKDRKRLTLAEVARLREAVEWERSLVHHTVEAYDADRRVGARLVDSNGYVLQTRVPTPSRHANPMARTIVPGPEPEPAEGHEAEAWRSIIRDRRSSPWRP